LLLAAYLIVFFPGTVVWDMSEGRISSAAADDHLAPLLLTWCFRVRPPRRVFGSDNLGVFLFTLSHPCCWRTRCRRVGAAA
jgi:hypothetical protein